MPEPEAKPSFASVNEINMAQCAPDQLANSLVSSLIVEKTGDLIKDGYSFSIRTILKLLLLLSLGEIKGLVSSLLANVIPMIKQSPIYAVLFFTKISEIKTRTFKRQQPNLLIADVPVNHRMGIDANEQFVFALYGYIMTNSNCSFSRSASKIGINNLKDRFVAETISQIRVGEIMIIDHIDYEINMQTGEPIGMSITGVQTQTVSTIRTYSDLFNADQQRMLEANITSFKAKYSVQQLLKKCRKSSKYTELDIAKLVVRKYPQLDLDETCYAITILFAIYHVSMPGYGLNRCIDRLKTNQRAFFDPNNDYVDDVSREHEYVFNKYASFASLFTTSTDDIKSVFKYLFTNHIQSGTAVITLPKLPTKPKVKQLTIEIPSTEPLENVLELSKKFVDDVCKYQRSNSGIMTKIKINCLLLETQVTTSEIPNPAYEVWEEQKKMLDEYRELAKSPDANTPSVDLSKICIPPKKLSVEKTSRVVINKLLNETSKSLDTLYLRKADMDKLLTSLDQFHNKKEILASLGLPNKLNILLYGLPGTGKSTAIQAIATYLGRNIYYLDLKNAITNQDLQMMFEYVNKNVQNGGIIVIEDIDAMTDIVLKRESVAEMRVNQLVSSGDAQLSLEYLLNILQGTLTLDDSIFIVTTNHIDHLDPAFYRDGRFDVKIELKLTDHHQIQSIYQKFLNKKIPEHLLKRIPENVFSPATIIFHIKDYLFATDVPDEEIVAPFMTLE